MTYIVVVGSLNLDRTFRVAELPRAGVTQTVLEYAEGVGGKGANQAAAAAHMGVVTHMLGCVGEDAAGERIAAALALAGVETGGLRRVAEVPTGNAAILVTPAGENSIVVVPGANHVVAPEDLQARRGLLQGASMLLLQMETPLSVQAQALELAATAGVPVMLDPAPAGPVPPELMAGLAWFTPNESEARFYLEATGGEPALCAGLGEHAGAEQVEALCRYFQSLGPKHVLLKLGARGAALLTNEGRLIRVSAPPVQVVDTTGAGDTLNGALAAALVRGGSMEEALRFAVAAASLSTTKRGALAGLPDRAEVERWMNSPR